MAKHKAATEVTLAPHEERSAFQEFVHRHWAKGVALALVISAVVLFRLYSQQQRQAERKESWARLASVVDLTGPLDEGLPDGETLSRLAEEHADEITGPWVRALEIRSRLNERDYDGAKAAVDQLRADYPNHPLASQVYEFGEDEGSATLAEHVAERVGELQAWERGRGHLFENPPLPEDAPRVKLVTSAGTIVVGLYEERAPRHVENFLKLASEGFYEGTLFHRVVPGFMVQGGDPNTREGEPSTWGQGGPGYKIEPETDNGLAHFAGVLAAAKKGNEAESSGSQFYLTTGSPHHLDGQHTVFGTLLEGEDVLETIEEGELEGDRPLEPVEILSTEVVR